MKKLKAACVIMFIHGAFMEIMGCIFLIPLLLSGGEQLGLNKYFSFIVPYFSDNMLLMLICGLIYGVLCVLGAAGLWKNKMWGLALSLINCVISLSLMMFMLPNGIMDGLFSGSALVLILTGYFKDKKALQ